MSKFLDFKSKPLKEKIIYAAVGAFILIAVGWAIFGPDEEEAAPPAVESSE